jgi:hypothetical protein
VVASSPRKHGWKRPTWTREMLVKTIFQKTGVHIHVATMSRALRRIGARRGRPKRASWPGTASVSGRPWEMHARPLYGTSTCGSAPFLKPTAFNRSELLCTASCPASIAAIDILPPPCQNSAGRDVPGHMTWKASKPTVPAAFGRPPRLPPQTSSPRGHEEAARFRSRHLPPRSLLTSAAYASSAAIASVQTPVADGRNTTTSTCRRPPSDRRLGRL